MFSVQVSQEQGLQPVKQRYQSCTRRAEQLDIREVGLFSTLPATVAASVLL